jgi:hypothetical protein
MARPLAQLDNYGNGAKYIDYGEKDHGYGDDLAEVQCVHNVVKARLMINKDENNCKQKKGPEIQNPF